MKPVSGKKLAVILEDHGWKLVRIHGSHHIYAKKDCEARLSVPIHGNKKLKIGLIMHIMKLAELNEEDFK